MNTNPNMNTKLNLNVNTKPNVNIKLNTKLNYEHEREWPLSASVHMTSESPTCMHA